MGSTTESVPRESRDFRQTCDLKHRVQTLLGLRSSTVRSVRTAARSV